MAESMIIKAIEELSVLSKGLDPALAQYVLKLYNEDI